MCWRGVLGRSTGRRRACLHPQRPPTFVYVCVCASPSQPHIHLKDPRLFSDCLFGWWRKLDGAALDTHAEMQPLGPAVSSPQWETVPFLEALVGMRRCASRALDRNPTWDFCFLLKRERERMHAGVGKENVKQTPSQRGAQCGAPSCDPKTMT